MRGACVWSLKFEEMKVVKEPEESEEEKNQEGLHLHPWLGEQFPCSNLQRIGHLQVQLQPPYPFDLTENQKSFLIGYKPKYKSL